ncbi:DUF222 domain-containing protein [Microbacterium sp. 1P10UB]|uniref:HNH endonuclease signature motif containing protein n=1 Tax=unclassified Microbacterium TaxID=2609290 RepID=UPI0039A32936
MSEDDDPEPYPGYWDEVTERAAAFTPRDAVGQVTDIAAVLTIQTAEQYASVAALRRETMTDAGSSAVADEMIDRSLRLELAAALRLTEYAVGDLLARSTALVERYPAALDAMMHARITDQHARYLVDLLDAADAETAVRLTRVAVALAEELPAGSFRRRLRRLIETEEAVTLAERHARAVAERCVTIEAADDGMMRVTAYLPAVEAHAAFDRLTRMAKAMTGRGRGDARPFAESAGGRSLDQARADILCDLLIDGVCADHDAAVRGIRPTVLVTVPALSLLDPEHARSHPAEVEGIGPIGIDRARKLCGAAASWVRILTHPETGIALSVGRTRYDPPPELRRLVRWRAERCLAPGCTMPASRCEIDHTRAWVDGGETSLENLAPLCTGHHHVKHSGGWSVQQVAGSGGVMEWISPTGRRYLVEPERRMPVFRSSVASEPAPF